MLLRIYLFKNQVTTVALVAFATNLLYNISVHFKICINNKKERRKNMNINFDINEFIKKFENTCHRVQKKTFSKNEVITSYINKRNQFCILVHGNADLVRYDLSGNRTIVEHFSEGDVFGEVFYTITINNELLVEAREKCEVLFYIYDDIRSKCRNNCKFHQELSDDLPELILSKVTDLNTRIELLTKRSIRDKLIRIFYNVIY